MSASVNKIMCLYETVKSTQILFPTSRITHVLVETLNFCLVPANLSEIL